MSADSSAQRLFDVFKDPVLALLLWTTVLTGKVNQSICRLLGVTELDIQSLESLYGDELRTLAALRVADSCSAELGKLLSGYVSGHLVTALLNKRDQEMEHYARMLARLPRWIREPDVTALEREARHEAATVRLLEAHARRDEVKLRRSETALMQQELERQLLAQTGGTQAEPAAPAAATPQTAASSATTAAAGSSPETTTLPSAASVPANLSDGHVGAASEEAPAAAEAAAADSTTLSVVTSKDPQVKSVRRNQRRKHGDKASRKPQPARPKRLRIA